MGQKVRPTGFRIGIMEPWRSRWYCDKREFANLLVEDQKIREFVKKFTSRGSGKGEASKAGIARIDIERTRDEVKVILYAARPGVVIGRDGKTAEELTHALEKLTGRKINLKINELSRPQLNAQFVAEEIAEQLSKRASFRRTMKKAIDETMEAGAQGIRVQLSGRLGGAEMARQETASAGRIPLQTLRAIIDYGFAEAKTAQGHIGIKVWINQGDYLSKESEDAAHAKARKVPKKPAGAGARAGSPG
ncbi:MAG: 30S ribosomal protein S3 [Gemmatales bacterium]|nr:30S ribosomal protein S3 [Gemmatales bacterium]MDW8386819.1 30S ribosomal protein S3 [Gemmatales bacterium]